MTISIRSRFNRVPAILVTDALGNPVRRRYLDRRRRFLTTSFRDDKQYEVHDGDEWARIAWKTLGTSTDWWIIAEVNDVIDPWAELRERKEGNNRIRIPSANRVAFELTSFRGRRNG